MQLHSQRRHQRRIIGTVGVMGAGAIAILNACSSFSEAGTASTTNVDASDAGLLGDEGSTSNNDASRPDADDGDGDADASEIPALPCADASLIDEPFNTLPTSPPWAINQTFPLQDLSLLNGKPGPTGKFLFADVTVDSTINAPTSIIRTIQTTVSFARLRYFFAREKLANYSEMGCALGLWKSTDGAELKVSPRTNTTPNAIEIAFALLPGSNPTKFPDALFAADEWHELVSDMIVGPASTTINVYSNGKLTGTAEAVPPVGFDSVRVECGIIFMNPTPAGQVETSVAIDNVQLSVCP